MNEKKYCRMEFCSVYIAIRAEKKICAPQDLIKIGDSTT